MSEVTLELNLSLKEIRKIKPLHDWLLVEKFADKNKTSSGGIILVGKEARATTGTVISAGPGCLDYKGKYRETFVKQGDHIMFKPFAGITLYDKDDIKIALIKEPDVVGFFE